uniref:Uncharacterized protein n=1 Tax=Romanomermis culicivorax TaxID=13658 RepID=A0A915I297_ROMCU
MEAASDPMRLGRICRNSDSCIDHFKMNGVHYHCEFFVFDGKNFNVFLKPSNNFDRDFVPSVHGPGEPVTGDDSLSS